MEVAPGHSPITAHVSGLRPIGPGVAFTIASPEIQAIHTGLGGAFMPWLGGGTAVRRKGSAYANGPIRAVLR
jgi:hypothetical protein